jgi:hypothetical protein
MARHCKWRYEWKCRKEEGRRGNQFELLRRNEKLGGGGNECGQKVEEHKKKVLKRAEEKRGNRMGKDWWRSLTKEEKEAVAEQRYKEWEEESRGS